MTFGFQEIKIEDAPPGKIITLVIVGKLESYDYDKFVPQIEELVEQEGKIRLLVELHDFGGFSAGAMWEDFKLGVRHANKIERLAVVGDKAWERAMTAFASPFTTAKVRYFDQSKLQEAKNWIREAE